MPDPDDQTSSKPVDQQQPQQQQQQSFMDFDFDLTDCSWPLDHLSLITNSNPVSPLLMPTTAPTLSSSEMPFSPLWAFSDDDNNNKVPFQGGSHRVPDYPRFISYALDSGNENPSGDGDKRRMPSPFIGLLPLDNPDTYCLIKERMTQALRYFKDWTEQHILVQVWAPVKNGSRYVLTTSGQPFVLGPNSNGLHQYRMVSLMYMFNADGETDVELGLPGRVFRQKLPEWTPNVQYYSDREYSRLSHAFQYNVRGTLALPVFEPSGQACVGVVELIMTSQKINYAPEVDKVCKALEAVNLKSSDILDHPTNTQICNEGRQNALAEILEILTVVCETHKLPLAQTWVPCMHRSVLAHGGGLKKTCTSIDGSCMGQVCMSTTDVSFYIVDAHMWGFREACVEHHLQKGQGVAGRAFLSQNSCFCRDITMFRKTDYPLVHYARMFGLNSCFAICLQSSHTGDDDYILEFFLPPNIQGKVELDHLLGSMMATMRQHFQSMCVASGIDLEGDIYVEVVEASATEMVKSSYELVQIPHFVKSPSPPETSLIAKEILGLELSQKQSGVEVDVPNDGSSLIKSLNDRGNINHVNGSSNPRTLPDNKNTKKTSERKRGKAEKQISLEVLQQYFSGSLKDAAKSLGVCPTTMKRICRQHGIARWPSRKINKVNRSLTKLKRVIESVQGADGTFDLASLSSPLPVPVSSSWPPGMNGNGQQDSPGFRPFEFQVENNESAICEASGNDAYTVMEDHLPQTQVLNQEYAQEKFTSPSDLHNGANSNKSGGSSSREESAGTPTSHNSCHGSPANESVFARDPIAASINEQCHKVGASLELPFQQISTCSMRNGFAAPETKKPFRQMLIEESGSSKDLKNLCPSAADATLDDRVPESSWSNFACTDLTPKQTMATLVTTVPHPIARERINSMTIKASYREDIVRFRVPTTCSIVELKEEIAKRFRLEIGTFDIKYLDDDHEWVLIACDVDLQECIDISRSSGSNAVRVLVHDTMSILGSSCESNGE